MTCRTAPSLAGALWLKSHMTFEIEAGVTLKAATDPSAFPFVYARFEGTMRFGHAGLLNAGTYSEWWMAATLLLRTRNISSVTISR